MSMNEPATTPAPGDQTVDPTLSGASRAITPAQRMDALRELNRGRSKLGFLWEWTKIFQVSVLLFLLIRTFLVEAFKIPSGSMENTLQVGDFLLVNKLVYGAEVPFTHTRLPRLREPQHGDVIVFEWPEDLTKNFVKRLVGLPGDTVEMRAGKLIRNGTVVSEGYVEHTEPDMDPAPEDFKWQRDYLVRTRRPRPRDTIRPETTGVRWSSQKGTTLSWATIGTTRSTVGTGDGWPTRWSRVARS